jgi:hypothetical protein
MQAHKLLPLLIIGVLRFSEGKPQVSTKPEVLLFENLTKAERYTENSARVNLHSHKTKAFQLLF